LVAQIQVPAAQLGLPQTFTFSLSGYQPTTTTAVAMNNAIVVQATLPRAAGAAPAGPRTLRVTGRGGGAIYDNHTTRSVANVSEPCVIQRLSVTLRGEHSYHSDLLVQLSGPAGQRATLQRRQSQNPFRTYRVNRANGTQAQGRWRLSIRDEVSADAGQLRAFVMNFTCQ
jgi:hypothetical protein